MIDVDVLGVRVERPTNTPIVLLRERDTNRHVPVWIGAAEAAAITYAQQGVVPPRPLTHDLLKDVIVELGHTVTEVRIVALVDSVFHAVLVIDGEGAGTGGSAREGGAAESLEGVGGIEIDSRASDAIALALRVGCPVKVAPEVLDEAGIVVTTQEDDEVERFKEFLDHVSAEDFDGPEPPAAREEPPHS